ncbi:DNA repair protein RecN [Bizionia argentinensis JUB59]|uniref:DNA repair protein RecN n=1 Tax=Bizionia argentinensis JUB59 TaxID=1046627 RepID=G2EGP8_9FLAO|nr:DNA repair protein RecN [Bizionia argentinensis]EGV42411.1 DNA repair protein RecN [Bizionia argentinensis JUB59]
MLTALTIKNYALIDHLQVNFNQGLTIITGETGAGKSILLGGLSLILGKRADLSALKNTEVKCVIEAVFDVSNYKLESLFKKFDFDYEALTIIRREILPSGKSRAFVNDSPVNLNGLQALGAQLIDIHSQHETMQLMDDAYQFQVIDALANNQKDLQNYKAALKTYKILQKEYDELLKFQAEAIKEHDYNSYLLKELEEAKLIDGELQELEETYETLNNVEDIKEELSAVNQLLSEEQIGVMSALLVAKNGLQKISKFSGKYEDVFNRVASSSIEINDIFTEIESLQEDLDLDPEKLTLVSNKLELINTLLKKHLAGDVAELISIKNELSEKVAVTERLDDTISDKLQEVEVSQKAIDALAHTIHTKRMKSIPGLTKELEALLQQLGMPNARFNITLNPSVAFRNNGKDDLSFLFSANKGGAFNELKKAASGGELSRIMLAIKSILSNYVQLPSIMFDEIDSGVSGEISNKMGEIMRDMSKSMQVFTITHIPQIAAKGNTHYKVYKEDVGEVTQTNLRLLNHDERIVEIAQMLGGIEISTSAMAHAKQLLN